MNESRVTIRSVAKLLGKMISSFPGIKYGKLHYRSLERCKILALKENYGNFDAKMTLNEQAIEDIAWWMNNVENSYNTITVDNPQYSLTTDASLLG